MIATTSVNQKHIRHSSEPESLRSTTATNYVVLTSTRETKVLKPPINSTKHSNTQKIANVSSTDFVSNNKNKVPNIINTHTNLENLTTQNNYMNTTNNNKSRKSSTNSNQSYLLNFKEKQKMTNSNSNNIEKKGNIF